MPFSSGRSESQRSGRVSVSLVPVCVYKGTDNHRHRRDRWMTTPSHRWRTVQRGGHTIKTRQFVKDASCLHSP